MVGHRVRDLAMYPRGPLDLVPLGRKNKIRCAGLEGQLSEGRHCWIRAATQAGRGRAVVCKTLAMEGQAKYPSGEEQSVEADKPPCSTPHCFLVCKMALQTYQGAMSSKWVNTCDQWGWATTPDPPEVSTLNSSNGYYYSKGYGIGSR